MWTNWLLRRPAIANDDVQNNLMNQARQIENKFRIDDDGSPDVQIHVGVVFQHRIFGQKVVQKRVVNIFAVLEILNDLRNLAGL